MASPRLAVVPRATSNGYSAAQLLLLGLWVFDIRDRAGFNKQYEGDDRTFMPRLLLGVCIGALKNRPLSMTEAFNVMDAKHGRTASKYIELAISQKLVRKVPDPGGDSRKSRLIPTELLLERFAEQMAEVAGDAKTLIQALDQVKKVNGVTLRGKAGKTTSATAALPLRARTESYFGPK